MAAAVVNSGHAMYRLVFQNRDATRPPFFGGDGPVFIGRDATCTLRLTDGGVSDRHAQIERRADGYYLRDLDSANGVRVNAQRVTEQRLAGGDEIELGAGRLTFEIVHDPPPERRALDPLQCVAIVAVAVLVAGQIILFGRIFSQEHPRRGRTDIVRGGRHQAAPAATNTAPQELLPMPATGAAGAPSPTTEVLNHMLRVARVERADTADGVTLRIQIKAQVGERQLDPGSVAIGVQFFAAPATPRNVVWLTVPADWENFSSQTFTVKSPDAPSRCAGYVVRTYYRKKLQDVYAVPAALAQTP